MNLRDTLICLNIDFFKKENLSFDVVGASAHGTTIFIACDDAHHPPFSPPCQPHSHPIPYQHGNNAYPNVPVSIAGCTKPCHPLAAHIATAVAGPPTLALAVTRTMGRGRPMRPARQGHRQLHRQLNSNEDQGPARRRQAADAAGGDANGGQKERHQRAANGGGAKMTDGAPRCPAGAAMSAFDHVDHRCNAGGYQGSEGECAGSQASPHCELVSHPAGGGGCSQG